ncbi:MAG: class I SAM-dependent methyltransferase [Saprospiraceae bacterium]|nr:class I SAM-dependent methyltransferase [Saprospiraceae bacterium]
MNILDIGCGSAWVAKSYSELYNEYVGIDFNKELIKQLEKDFLQNSRCSFFMHDIQIKNHHLFKSRKYNLILANFILLELLDLKYFLKILLFFN